METQVRIPKMVFMQPNGWWFYLIDQASGTSLRRVRRDYVNAMAVDIEDDEPDDEGDKDEG